MKKYETNFDMCKNNMISERCVVESVLEHYVKFKEERKENDDIIDIKYEKVIKWLFEPYKEKPYELKRVEFELIKHWYKMGYKSIEKVGTQIFIYPENITNNFYLSKGVFGNLFDFVRNDTNKIILEEVLNNYKIIKD